MYKEKNEGGGLQVKVSENEERKAVFYWGVAEVDKKNFDIMVTKLENSIEEAKIGATSLVIAQLQDLDEQGGGNEEKLILLLSFLKEKRIPVQIVEMLIIWGHEALARMIKSNGGASNDTELNRAVEWLKRVEDPEVAKRVRNIVERVATGAGSGVIVTT